MCCLQHCFWHKQKDRLKSMLLIPRYRWFDGTIIGEVLENVDAYRIDALLPSPRKRALSSAERPSKSRAAKHRNINYLNDFFVIDILEVTTYETKKDTLSTLYNGN